MADDKGTLAEAIMRIGDAMRKLESSGLNRRAVIVLLHDATKLPKRDIELMLDTLPKLQHMFCR